MSETPKRSLYKLISWRLIGILFYPAVGYWITGNWIDTGLFTLAFLIMTVLYYFHERLWNKIPWGKDN